MRRSLLVVALALAAVVAAAGLAISDGAGSCAEAQGGNACVSSCRAAHSDCRIRTKGSPSCDAQFQACMQGCLKH